MSGPGFKQVEKLFHAVLGLAPEQRAAFLDAECGADSELRAAVENLLLHDDTAAHTETFLTSPVADAAGQLRADTATVQDLHHGPITPASPLSPDIPGYEFLGELGRGGMGVVYQARQTSLNRIVAVKMLLPESAPAPELLARFRSEAEVLARLQHPHIIAIYEIGMAQGRPYFSMEYVAGPSLARLLDGRPQDIAGSARLLETLARTMDAVHKQGIVHRDLKPANILISTESKGLRTEAEPAVNPPYSGLSSAIPKITDFGLAKDQNTSNKLTRSGVVMGTLCYMAPEQAQGSGHAVGPAADLYALGAILYEMLTGRPPFDAPTTAEAIAQLLHEEPLSPMGLRPKLPRDLATICLKCLEKAPHRRYASALDLAEDLRRFQAGEAILARPVGFAGRVMRWSRRRPVVAGLLCLVGLLVLVLAVTVVIYDARLESALARAEAKAEQERQQIVQLNVTIGFAELKRGEAFEALLRFTEALRLDEESPERERDHRMRIATTLRQCPRLLSLRIEERRVLFSHLGPAGGWLATVGLNDNLLDVRDVFTGQAVGRSIALTEPVLDGAISHDGRTVATLGTGGTTRVWDLTTGKSEPLPCRGNEAVTRVAIHPDGRILVTQHVDSTIRRWDLAARPLVLPRPLSGSAASIAALSENARWLFTVNASGVGQLWDVATGKAVSKPVPVGQQVSLATVSSEGGRVAFAGPGNTHRLWDMASSQWIGTSVQLRGAPSLVVLSPDAQRALVISGSRWADVWSVQTGEWVALARDPGTTVTQARFGPDSRVLVTTEGTGPARVWNALTGEAVTPPMRHGGPLAAAFICANGKEVETISRSGTAARWLLPTPAEKKGDTNTWNLTSDLPVAELIALAQVLACGRIDEKQERQVLAPDRLRAAWASHQPR